MDFLSFTERKKPVAVATKSGSQVQEKQASGRKKTFIPQIPDKPSAQEYVRRLVYMNSALHNKMGQPFYGSLPFKPSIGEGQCLSFSHNEVFFLFHCGGVGDFSLMARSFNEQESTWVYIVAYEKHYAHKILYATVANNGHVALVAREEKDVVRIDILDKEGVVLFHKAINISEPFSISGNQDSTQIVIDEYHEEEGYKSSQRFHSVVTKGAPSFHTVDIEGLAYHEVVVQGDFFRLIYQNKAVQDTEKSQDFVHILDRRGNHWSKLSYRKYIAQHVPPSKQFSLYKQTYTLKEERMSHRPYLDFLLTLTKRVKQPGLYEEIGACYLHNGNKAQAIHYWEQSLKRIENAVLQKKYEALLQEQVKAKEETSAPS